MSTHLPDPERWTDLAAQGANVERTIGAAFRRVREATEPSDTVLARLAGRLAARRRSPALQLAWRIAVIVAVIAATGSVVGAAFYRWRRVGATTPAAAAAAQAPRDALRGLRPAAVARSPNETAAATVVALEPATVPPRRPTAPELGARRMPPPPPAGEAGMLADVFRELRSRGDARAALRALDEYDRQFPAGGLKSEARVARAEALLALDRRRDALPLLEGLEQAGFAPTRDLRVARGRATRGGRAVRAGPRRPRCRFGSRRR